MPGKISLLAAAIVTSTATAAALVAFHGTSSGGPAEARAPAGSLASASSLANDERRFFLPEAGYRYVYGFRRKISFDGDLGGAKMQPVGFGGELYVDVLRADDHGFEAVVSERIEGAPAPRAPFARIEAGARGDEVGFFRAEGLSEEESQHVSVVKDLVSLWLFPLRSDTVGDFEARFDPMPAEPGFAREKKTKLAYRSHAPNVPSILSSEHYLLWDFALHLPKEVKGIETTRLGRDAASITAESRYQLLFRSREKAPDYGHGLLAALYEGEALALDTSKALSLADHPDYKNLDWGKITADLKDIARLSPKEQLNVFGDVVKFLRLHPERAADLAELLRDPSLLKAGADSPVFRTIVGALATSGSSAAMAALREAYDSAELAGPGKETILAALTTTQAPVDSATRDFLAQKMQSADDPRLAQGAAFALGSALQGAANDEQSASAIALIQSRFASAGGAAERMAMLDVMGNSGRAEFLPTLEAVLASGAAPEVKAKAEFALRFIKTGSATLDLTQGLASGSTNVREAAAGAIAVADWNEAYRAPLETCASQEAVSRIQSSCQSTLTSHPRVADSQ